MELYVPVADGEAVDYIDLAGQQVRVWWHGSGPPPPGMPHGSTGLCVVPDGRLIVVSEDGKHWDLPGGRPEVGESTEETLRREVREEACATVTSARLLGYTRGECIGGAERGLVLVRSIWAARVSLEPWAPAFETQHRRLVAAADLHSVITLPSVGRIVARAMVEAGIVSARQEV